MRCERTSMPEKIDSDDAMQHKKGHRFPEGL
jgi:hypothetical protein